MEQKLNIAEILKDKPVELKLYSSTFGYIKFNGVHKDKIYFSSEDTNVHSVKTNGKMYDGGECIIFPSKEMRDWSKFAWNKGDVLVSNDGGTEVIFDKWYDETYTSFYCKHYLNSEDENKIVYYETFLCTTERYSLEDKDSVQTYIKTIEEKLGGKLNRETLEIEKTQPEFKDGDIVCISGMGYFAYGIVKSIDYSSKKLEYYVLNDMSTLKFEDWLSFEDKQIQPITETQQIILFDTLAKRGKAWDAEKKQIVDLKLKWTPKPFDKVVVRCGKADKWSIDFFSYKVSNGYICTGDAWFGYCLPYNEETAHLLGTTDDWEGGEQ
jgi:hypothetical protein|nr:MAG TPA: hypothetical protein [Caudoviricetes sp.]